MYCRYCGFIGAHVHPLGVYPLNVLYFVPGFGMDVTFKKSIDL